MKKKKVSIIINSIIVILVVIGIICMFNDISFMGRSQILTTSKIEMFKFFTVDSNILMGLASLLYIINHKKEKRIIYQFKLIATTSVTLTFIITAFYLVPTSKYPILFFYQNSNLFFHLIVPILSIITFTQFEKNSQLKQKDCFLGLIPIILYSIYYTGNILIHFNQKSLIKKYDFYGFLIGGKKTIIIVILIILFITYSISHTLWYLNHNSKKEN